MSKIGRKPIELGSVQVDVKGNEIHYKGKTSSGVHIVPECLEVQLSEDKKSLVLLCKDLTRENKTLWGLHRALLANKFIGADTGFIRELKINGLGYKGILSGNKITFSLGYSHKIDFPLPEGISVEIDKTGQNLKIKGSEKEKVGLVASKIRALRPPEPYKGTGVKFLDETILRKAGKTKSA